MSDILYAYKAAVVSTANGELAYGVRDLSVGEVCDLHGNVYVNNQLVRIGDNAARILTYINYAFDMKKTSYSNTPGDKSYYAWCGAFATFVSFPFFLSRGYEPEFLRPLASVSRTAAKFKHACIPFSAEYLVIGDIVTVGSPESKVGTHFVVVVGIDIKQRSIVTIEGNGMVGGESNKFEGVVTRRRKFDVCRLIVKQELV